MIYRYILKEFLIPFGIALFAVIAILILGKIVPLLDIFAKSGATLKDLLRTCGLLSPIFLQFAVPMAGLFGLLTAYLRLTRDSEIISLFAVGTSPRVLLVPSIIVGLALFCFSLILSLWIVPMAKMEAKTFLRALGQRSLFRGVPEGRFFELTKGLVIFTNKNKGHGKKLKGVFVWDARKKDTPFLIYSKQGKITGSKTGESIGLSLQDGILTSKNKGKDLLDIVGFKEYALKIVFSHGQNRIGRGEMSIKELFSMSKSSDISREKRLRYTAEFHKRIAIPVGAFVLCLLAPPLGIFFGRSGLSIGISLGISAYLAYYLLSTLCANLFETGVIPYALTLWVPDLILGGLSLFAWTTLYKKGPVSLS